MTSYIETIASWLLPLFVTVIVLVVQWMFWFPSIERSESTSVSPGKSQDDAPIIMQPNNNIQNQVSENNLSSTIANALTVPTQTKRDEELEEKDMDKNIIGGGANDKSTSDDLFQTNDQWRCACEGGFLPPGLLKSFGGAEAMMRLGTGQCYHKQM